MCEGLIERPVIGVYRQGLSSGSVIVEMAEVR
jgi:hypothetical protein